MTQQPTINEKTVTIWLDLLLAPLDQETRGGGKRLSHLDPSASRRNGWRHCRPGHQTERPAIGGRLLETLCGWAYLRKD